MEYSDEKTFINISLDYYPKTQLIEEENCIDILLSYILEGFGIICERQDSSLFIEKFINIFDYINEILNRNKTEKNLITYDKAIRAFGKFVYFKCDNMIKFEEKEKIKIANNFLKLLPATYDLKESDKICSDLFEQITDEKCRLLFAEGNEEETKRAIYRIIELNSKTNFIEDLTKLLKVCLTMGLNFSHLVD